jgi:hypothetical protein
MAINPAEITTIRVGELPTGEIELTSKIAIENATDLQQNTMQEVVDFLNINSNAFQFEIKDLFVNQAYIDDNFNETGLGTDLMLGWAMCNGQNGTPNLDGLVGIGYGTNYNVINAVGGSKNAVVVEHSHSAIIQSFNESAGGNPFGSGGGSAEGTHNYSGNTNPFTIVNAGVSGANKNMQPYMVLLKIMKL